MEANETASRLAPPTREPSMSGCAMSDFTLSGLTLPPYRMRTAACSLFFAELLEHLGADGLGQARRRPFPG